MNGEDDVARRGWTLAAAVALLVTLAAGPAPAWAQVEVRMWTLLSGGDGARMRALVEDFNASQREVRVVSTTLKWGEPFYTKLITSSVVGAGPDLATIHLSRLVNLAGGGVLRPVTDAELAAAGLKGSDYLPRQWDKARWQGQTWAVPLDTHPLVLYYNKKLAGQAGLLDAEGNLKPIEGVDALTEAFRVATERTGRRGLTMESSQSSFAIWRLWLSMLAQQNIPIVRNGQYSYGPAGEAVLSRISDWFRKGYAQAGLDYPASTSQFMGGSAAFMLNGVWEVPELVRASKAGTLGFDYGIVPLPKMYANANAWADSHAFAIPANAGNPASKEKVAAVLRFVAYVGRH
jgi:multiple sugar transport system substrate-binding protein